MKNLLSYFIPVRIKNYISPVSGNLEINLVNGKKILDTSCSNYSYGSLQKILETGLRQIKFDSRIQSILILGLGAGSVIESIRDVFRSQAPIIAVEIDAQMIEIAINDFNINRFKNLTLIQSDAFAYMQSSKHTFDLIIVDIFVGDTIPDIFTTPDFVRQLVWHLNSDGKIIYNTLKNTIKINTLHQIQHELMNQGMKVKILDNVEWTNDLILAYNT